jgi:hypothetical protein
MKRAQSNIEYKMRTKYIDADSLHICDQGRPTTPENKCHPTFLLLVQMFKLLPRKLSLSLFF